MSDKVMVVNVEKMSSVEIAELTGKRHDNVTADIKKQLSELGVDLLKFQEVTVYGAQGQKRTVYNLDKEQTLILASGYNVQLRSKIINRWIELEEQKQPQTLSIDMMIEAYQEQKAINEKNAPKIEYYNTVLDSSTLFSITDIAQSVQMTGQALNQFLKAHNVQYKKGKRWFLSAKHLGKGFTGEKTFAHETGTSHSLRWTEKGKKAIIKLVDDIRAHLQVK